MLAELYEVLKVRLSSLQLSRQRPKKYWRVRIACLVVVGIVECATASAVPGSRPAYWAQHDEIVYLKHLPKPYSCNDLYYIFRDVIEDAGARAGAKILPFGCSGTPGTSLSDPTRVELHYQLPKPLAAAVPASFTAKLNRIELTPGNPSSLHAGDCQLVKDLTTTLLPSISPHIESKRLRCVGAQGSHSDYSVTLQAWKPASTPAESTK